MTSLEKPASPSGRPLRHGGARGVLADAALIAAKDLRIELRTREIVATTGFFGALVAVLASVAFTTTDATAARVAPGTIWLAVAFASVLAFGRAWQREREEQALVGLLVTPIARASIFLGKTAGAFAFLVVVELIVVPLVALFFHVDLPAVAAPLAVVLSLGTLGVSAAGTLFGAMTARTRARDLVLASVLFPLLSPALLTGVGATREIIEGARLADLGDYLLLLGVFAAVALAAGVALFATLLDDA